MIPSKKQMKRARKLRRKLRKAKRHFEKINVILYPNDNKAYLKVVDIEGIRGISCEGYCKICTEIDKIEPSKCLRDK